MSPLVPKSMVQRRCCFIFLVCSFSITHYFFGAFTKVFELDYHTFFAYPLEIDIKPCVENLKYNETSWGCPIINSFQHSYLSSCGLKCQPANEMLTLVYVVKSAMNHFERRNAIRKSWGSEKQSNGVIRTVFMLGIEERLSSLQEKIAEESTTHRDIIQADFIDTYFNGTLKTMMGFEWVIKFCSNSKFYFFIDDDVYVSTKNVLRFIKDPRNYPENLETPVASVETLREDRRLGARVNSNAEENYINNLICSLPKNSSSSLSQHENSKFSADLKLYAGYVFFTAPHRHLYSKWYITLSEYPFNMWPPYVSSFYILSSDTLRDFYYASRFTKRFRFEDVYLGILAKKMDIEPFNCHNIHVDKKTPDKYDFSDLIVSHGYDDPQEMLKLWNDQKSVGNA